MILFILIKKATRLSDFTILFDFKLVKSVFKS